MVVRGDHRQDEKIGRGKAQELQKSKWIEHSKSKISVWAKNKPAYCSKLGRKTIN